MVCDGYSHVSVCRYVMCDGYSHVSVCRYVWYVMVTVMLVCAGMCVM